MKAAVYVRISQDREGAEVGVKNQEKAAEGLAKTMGADVYRVYRDNDAGASRRSKKARPGFAQLLSDAEAGRFDVIIAYSMSRLTRRPLEWVGLIELAEKKKLKFNFKVSPTFDLTTADGRATALTVAAWDAAEAERTGERIQFAMQSKLAKGQDIGGVRPFGYTPDRSKLIKKEADALKWAYQAILEGNTLVAIAREFTARGLTRDRAVDRSWRPQTIRNMLLRERNCGRLVIKGELYSEDLLPLIDVDTFNAVKNILTDPTRKPLRGRTPITQPFTGLLKCGVCGNYVRLAKVRGTIYLKCAPDGRTISTSGMNHPTITLNKADGIVSDSLRGRLMTLASLDLEFTSTRPTKDIQLRLAELRRQRDLAQDMIFDPGANVPSLKAKIATTGQEIDQLQLEYDQAVSADIGGSAIEAGLEIIRSHYSPEVWEKYWTELEVDHKRALIKALLPNLRLMLAESDKRILSDQLPALASFSAEDILNAYTMKWAEGTVREGQMPEESLASLRKALYEKD